MSLRIALLLALLAAPLAAQEDAQARTGDEEGPIDLDELFVDPDEEDRLRGLFRTAPRRDDDGEQPVFDDPVYNRPAPAAQPTAGAVLLVLDKMTGRTERVALSAGDRRDIGGRLRIELEACLVPPPDRPDDAFAWMAIRDLREDAPRFTGWMLASSPALHPLDHARYDVWVESCSTSSIEALSDSAKNSD